jgi:hypothetical protein
VPLIIDFVERGQRGGGARRSRGSGGSSEDARSVAGSR